MIHTSDMKKWLSHLHLPRFAHAHLSHHDRTGRQPHHAVSRWFWLALAITALVALLVVMVILALQGDLGRGDAAYYPGIPYYPGMLF